MPIIILSNQANNDQQPVQQEKIVAGSIDELFAKKEFNDQLKTVAAERPILREKNIEEIRTENGVAVVLKEQPEYEVHKDITLVRNRNKLSKRSQYLNDLLTFDNK